MKFVHGFLVLTAIAALTASAEETAYEGQSIGSIAIVSSSPRTIVPVAFQELSAVDGQNVCISNILRTTNLLDGDQVFLYTSAGYQSWKLQGGQWVDNDATFALKATGEQDSGVGAKADMTRVNVGEGFWLYRPNTSGNRDYAKPFYIFGAYAVTEKTVTVTTQKTLLGNPTITEKSPTIENPAAGDHLYVEKDGVLTDYSYSTKFGWSYEDSKGEFQDSPNPPPLAPGQGFWYTTEQLSVTFKW